MRIALFFLYFLKHLIVNIFKLLKNLKKKKNCTVNSRNLPPRLWNAYVAILALLHNEGIDTGIYSL